MRAWIVLFMMLLLVAAKPAIAADTDYSKASPQELIDALTLIDCGGPGFSQTGIYADFVAEDGSPQFLAGLLGGPPPCVPPQLREIVRRGPTMLSMLIQHLSDERATRLVVGTDKAPFFDGQFFNHQYDPRVRSAGDPRCASISDCMGRKFEGTYVVRVGDIVFAAIGQIVNRRLFAVRYQPSLILFVNSPIQEPVLAQRAKADWDGITAKDLEASFLTDVRTADDQISSAWAFQRLRFYFPEAYAGLTGADLEKRTAFESYEQRQRK